MVTNMLVVPRCETTPSGLVSSALSTTVLPASRNHGAPGSPLLKILSARMVARDYTPNFFLKLMAKDLGYAMAEGESHGIALQTATAALAVFRRALAANLGDQDFSAVVEPLRVHR